MRRQLRHRIPRRHNRRERWCVRLPTQSRPVLHSGGFVFGGVAVRKSALWTASQRLGEKWFGDREGRNYVSSGAGGVGFSSLPTISTSVYTTPSNIMPYACLLPYPSCGLITVLLWNIEAEFSDS